MDTFKFRVKSLIVQIFRVLILFLETLVNFAFINHFLFYLVFQKEQFENANVCLFIFDCLHINGVNIMEK